HVQAVLERGVVQRVAGRALRGDLVLTVAVADVRVRGGRRGVRDARGRHRAHRFAGSLGQLQQRHGGRAVVGGARAVCTVHVALAGGIAGLGVGRHGDDFVVHLHAGHVRRHRRRAVGGLRIVGVRLDARRALERFHRQAPGLAHLVDARGGDGGRAHAVAQEEDH
ncbi:hypothetical protein COLO4_01226, partial [Corchorus olitorius]